MKIGNKNTSDQVYIIAEVGNNHEGNFEVAKEMLRKAADTGVDAVKFQTIVPEKLVSSDQKDRIKQLKGFQLSYGQYEQLAELALSKNVDFISTPFDIESAQFLADLVPAFKIASSDNNFFPLLQTVCQTGKPIIMSSGMADHSELKTSIDFIKNAWNEFNKTGELSVLHCVSSYPTPIEEANLQNIRSIANSFDVTPGYSDHTLGQEACVLSVALGARVIEKHFTLANDYSDFRDHQLSADPDLMSALVENVRQAEKYLGSSSIQVNEGEKATKSAARRSIALNQDLEKGTVLNLDHLTWLRPGTGIQLGDENLVIGKILKNSIQQGEILSPKDLA